MASRLFTVDLDLGLNKARRFIFEDFSTNPTGTTGRVIYWTAGDSSANHLKVYNGTAWKTIAYTDDVPSISISLDAPDLFTVSGSPAGATGTLGFEWNVAAVNTVLAGPGTGSTAAIPTFRSLVATDIPDITSAKVSDFNEAVADAVGGMVTSNTESGISVTYQDDDNTLDFDVADFTITLSGDVSGSGTVTNLGNVSITTAVADDSHSHTSAFVSDFVEAAQDAAATAIVTNGSHTGITASYDDLGNGIDLTNTGVLALTAGTGIGITGTNANLTIANSGVVSLTGTENEVEVTNTGTSYTVGLPNNVTVAGKLTITGDLEVNGNTTTVNTATLSVEDNIVLLNNGVTASPSLNAGLEVERGTELNALLVWNETSDKWTAGISGSEAPIARKFVSTTTGTTHTIIHNLETLDVTVNCWLAGAQVEAAVVVTDANTVTVTTNSSITDLKTVVVG